jgi:hypothetical protein
VDPITQKDEELFGTVIVAALMGRSGPIVDRLRERYEKDADDPLAGLPYALAMLAQLQSGGGEREKLNYTEIVETLSDLLYYEPDHWLGRYLRIHTRTLLPVTAAEHHGYILAERSRATEDVTELIERQAGTTWQPWFTCSYLLAARLAWEADERHRIPALVAAATAQPAAAIGFRALSGLLCEGFLWYRTQPDLPMRAPVDALMHTLFPDLPATRPVPSGRSR